MFAFWSRRSALAIALFFSVSAAQADMITPGSIANPPTPVPLLGAPVLADNLVNTQYSGLGLRFYNPAAISQLNNTAVWVPIDHTPHPTTDYSADTGISLQFVRPGSLTPTYVSSVTLDMIGVSSGTPNIGANSLYGQYLDITPVLQSNPGPDGGQLWTFTGPGISSIGIGPSGSQSGAWGVSGIAFTPSPAPEPSSLVLAGLGTLGLAGRFGWRRTRWVAKRL